MRRFAQIALLVAALWPAAAIAQEEEAAAPVGDGDEGGDGNADAGDEATDEATDAARGDADSERLSPDASAAPVADAGPIKVAVVTIGDPDDALRARARAIDMLLSREDALAVPADSGLRGALRGDPEPSEDDGLARVRRGRRALGMDDADDAGGLAALGRVSGAVAVVALRRGAGSIQATVLDVASARLYEGELDAGTADGPTIVEFVVTRARVSALRAREREAEQASDGNWREAAGGRDRRTTRPEEGDDAETDEDEGDDEPGFFAKYWPYMVAALLLGGALIYAFTVDTTPDTPPPVLRFIPGGN